MSCVRGRDVIAAGYVRGELLFYVYQDFLPPFEEVPLLLNNDVFNFFNSYHLLWIFNIIALVCRFGVSIIVPIAGADAETDEKDY